MRQFTMEDRSTVDAISGSAKAARTDAGLNLQQVFEMTDYSIEELDHIASMQPGDEFLIGRDRDIYIRRDK